MDYSQHSPVILGTCIGMRGIERGLERAFFRIGWLAPKACAYVEIDAFIAWNLVEQMEKGLLAPAPIWTNLKTFCWEVFRGKVDLITGGYPCQPFSLAGKLRGTDDPRHLWPYYKKGIRTIQPVGCFFENVRNHLNIGYEEVRRDLQGLGYQVEEGIFSAEETGAPHKRERLFVLALDHARCRRYQPADKEIQAGRIGPEPAGVKLDNAQCPGLERFTRNESQPEGWKEPCRPASPSGFPMGQGYEQYPWEEPRLKSRLDLTINGYDFTIDLLRMAGNGVVEQTAEIAFMNLLNKHFTQ